MDRPGNRKGEFALMAAAFVAIGLGLLALSLVPGLDSLLGRFQLSTQLLWDWGRTCALAGAAGLAIVLSVAYAEARTQS